jgi:predicted TPR repeat methyltransferase
MKRKTAAASRSPREVFEQALTHHDRGDLAAAEAGYRELIRLEPHNNGGLNLLAMILIDRGEPAAALPLIKRAIANATGRGVAWSQLTLGHYHAAVGNDELAVAAMTQSCALDPESAPPHYDLARHHLRHGRRDHALVALYDTIERQPDHARAQFLITSLTGGHADTAPASYVTELFDSYAPSFERHLQSLDYNAPALLAELVDAAAPAADRSWQVADLGCGSGRGGVAFRGRARHLIGSDLSPKMVELSRRRGVYDELHAEDLLATLARTPAALDLIVAADVFIYVGALEAAFAAAAAALAPGGRFAFSTEREPDSGKPDGFRLQASSRYAHGDGYIRGLAQHHALAVHATRDITLRVDHGRPIAGTLYLVTRDIVTRA